MHPNTMQEIARQRRTDLIHQADLHRLAVLARAPKTDRGSEPSRLSRFTRHLAIAR